MFRAEHIAGSRNKLHECSGRNTVKISENSEKHLKAMVGGRQVVGLAGVRRVPKCRRENRGAKKKSLRLGFDSSTRRRSVANWGVDQFG